MYRANVLKLVHPAGYKLFGKNRINRIINNTTSTKNYNIELIENIPQVSINDIEIKVIEI